MKKVKEKILKAIAETAIREFGGDGSTWPPPCIGYIYQPKRPKKSEKEKYKEF